jgi:[glutamine synthetase] adenylyltransferase / [glutamine synthetase]-adenylyl-L-tyrosine phosphorylase
VSDADNVQAAIENLLRYSRYAQRAAATDGALLVELETDLQAPWDAARMQALLAGVQVKDEEALKQALRRLRRRVLLAVMARDLSGRADLAEVVETMSTLADVAIRFALPPLEMALKERHGVPLGADSATEQQLIVVAMGKLGGGELNVSSDVDLIFVYPEEGETTGARRISNHEFFTLLGKKLIGALQEVTADGFVFRVDMRLRPYGDSGALVVSFAALDEYLVTQGRPWERYAWIKARPLTGDRAAELSRLVLPFVFRRYLDYSAFASLRDLHAQVRAEVTRRDRLDDVKLGPGGIREIEFIVQVFQLIRGGREAALQARATLATLATLRSMNLLPASACGELREAYIFLRDLEHRLQYLDDAQTQKLPARVEDQALVAGAMGFADYAAFREALERYRADVTRQFEAIFSVAGNGKRDASHEILWQAPGAEDAAAALTALGYSDPAEVVRRLQSIKDSARYRQLPDASRARFDEIVPLAIAEAGKLPAPGQTLARVLDLLEAVSRRGSYLALLAERPPTLAKVATLASRSPWAASYLRQHPVLLDELLDHRELLTAPDWRQIARALDEDSRDAEPDVERQMDLLRHTKQSQIFRLIAQDLEGLLTVEKLSDHLSDLADLTLSATLQLCWTKLAKRHRETPAFSIVGYGKLGGKELGYGSDLDIVFLFRDAAPEAAEIYARLAQRIITWLTSYTAAGVLYSTDLRLRPDGASGLLVSSFEAFESYQREHAWTWEHQALTRARFCAGDAALGADFEALRIALLRTPRDAAKLRAEVNEMRDKMRAEHKHARFDVKQSPGGLIDVEFIVQYLVLAHAHQDDALTRNVGNIALLARCAERGLIPTGLANAVADSYRALRRLQHEAWMSESSQADVSAESVAELTAPVIELWRSIFAID